MPLRQVLFLLLLAACAIAVAFVALTAGGTEPPPRESTVERRLRALAADRDTSLHEVHCERDPVLPRTFTCLVEGPDDLHLAWEVRWLGGGRLAVRRPDGTPVPF